jgi:hypothetical protein
MLLDVAGVNRRRGIDGESGGYDVERLRYGSTVVPVRHRFYSRRSAVLTSDHRRCWSTICLRNMRFSTGSPAYPLPAHFVAAPAQGVAGFDSGKQPLSWIWKAFRGPNEGPVTLPSGTAPVRMVTGVVTGPSCWARIFPWWRCQTTP